MENDFLVGQEIIVVLVVFWSIIATCRDVGEREVLSGSGVGVSKVKQSSRIRPDLVNPLRELDGLEKAIVAVSIWVVSLDEGAEGIA